MKEVTQFLGLTSYYRRFLKGFSDVAKPLYNLTKKNSVFKWDEKCEDAFVSLKDKLTTAPVLA